MSAATMVSFRAPVLAWADAADDQRLFHRVQRAVLGVTVLVCLLLLLWPRTPDTPAAQQALPPPMARLLLEHKAAPPTPPKPEVRAERKADAPDAAKPEAKDTSKPATEPKPQARPKVALPPAAVPEARVPQDNRAPGEVEAARRKVAGMGLLAARDEIAEVRGAPAAVQLRTDIKQGAGVGAGNGPGVGAGNEAGLPARSVITSNGPPTGSGGINTAALSRNTGGGGLAGRATTMVEGVAGGGGGGGAGVAGEHERGARRALDGLAVAQPLHVGRALARGGDAEHRRRARRDRERGGLAVDFRRHRRRKQA